MKNKLFSTIREYLRNRTKKDKQFRTINTSILIHIVIRNFINRKLRSSLTVAAVVIGVAAVFILLSFGLGIQALVTNQIIGNKSIKSVDVTSPNSKILKLDEEAINAFKNFNHVKKVGVQYSFPGIMKLGGGETDIITYGINYNYQNLSSLDLIEGRLLNESDSKSILISQSALKAYGISNTDTVIGKTVTITVPLERSGATKKQISDSFVIIGVIGSSPGNEVFIPDSNFGVAGVPNYNQVKVAVDDMANVSIVRSQIESKGFQTTSLIDTLNEINNIFKFINLILVSFGSIGMVVAILGMFNTLTISLLERTKEIGLMMALGGRRYDMRRLFIFEAILISFIGSVIGVLFAIISGKIINYFINVGAHQRGVTEYFELFATPLWAVILIISVTVLIGIGVVYFPARRAEKINPIDALRHE